MKKASSSRKDARAAARPCCTSLTDPVGAPRRQIVKDNLSKIGLEVDIKQFPAPVLFEQLATLGEPFDIGWIGWGFSRPRSASEPSSTDGPSASPEQNWSYFNSPTYNRLIDAAAALPVGRARERAYGELDVDIARNAAPGIPFGYRTSSPSSRQGRLHRAQPRCRPRRGLPEMTRALAATLFAALVLIPAAGTHGLKEGGTFRMAVSGGFFQSIDPALYGRRRPSSARPAAPSWAFRTSRSRPACQLSAELAEALPGGFERPEDVHVHDPQGRALLGWRACHGTARSFAPSSASSTRT